MSATVKGSSQVKSLASIKKSGAHSGDRHVRHFQIASLEMERSRRLKERQDALIRIQTVDERLQEIEETLRGHYDSLGLAPEAGPAESGTVRAVGGSRAGTYRRDEQGHEPSAGSAEPRRMLLYGR